MAVLGHHTNVIAINVLITWKSKASLPFDWLTNTFSGTLKPPMRAVLMIYTFDEIKQMNESQKGQIIQQQTF